MRRFLYIITNIIYNILMQIFIPTIIYIVTKDIKYFLIFLVAIYVISIIVFFLRKIDDSSFEEFNLEKMNLNPYYKYLVNVIRMELNKNGLKDVKIYSIYGHVMGMTEYGFCIDFNLSNKYIINNKFYLNLFISDIYHEIGHYKSGIILIDNKFVKFMLESTLLFQLSMMIKGKYLMLFSGQKFNFKLDFFKFLNCIFDCLNICRTMWLRNDEYFAERYAYKNKKYANLIYTDIFKEYGKAQDILHPNLIQSLKYGMKFLKPYKNIKGLYLVEDKLISLCKHTSKIDSLAKEKDPFALYTKGEYYMLGASKGDKYYDCAIQYYKEAADLGHEGAISFLVSNEIDTHKYLKHSNIENVKIAKLFEDAKSTNNIDARSEIKKYADKLNIFAIKCYINLCYYGYGSEANLYYIQDMVDYLKFTQINFIEDYPLIKNMIRLNENYSDQLYDKIFKELKSLNSTQKCDCYLFLIRDISTEYNRKISVINDYIDFIKKDDVDFNCKYIFKYLVESSFSSVIEQIFAKFSKDSKYYKMMLKVLCEYHIKRKEYEIILNLIETYGNSCDFSNKNYYLGETYYYKKDYKNALQYYSMVDSNDSEYPYCLYCIGFIYKVGTEEVKRDLNKAKEYFIKGSNLGSLECKKEIDKMKSPKIEYFIEN